jgi:hypothetical protein
VKPVNEQFPAMLGRDPEQAFDELLLAEKFTFRQPPDLTLSDDVHCFVSRDRAQCSFHRPETLTGQDPLLHETMILFDDVIQIGRWSAAASPTQFA